MTAVEGEGRARRVELHPALWLVIPTISLLIGQAAVALPWTNRYAGIALIAAAILAGLGSSRWRGLALLFMISLGAFAWGYRHHQALLEPTFAADHLRLVMSKHDSLLLEGRISQEPERLINRSRWLIGAERIWHPGGAEEIQGKILVTVRTMRRHWRYGDRVRVALRPSIPRDSGNPGGFNYARFLARRGIYAIAYLDHDQGVELLVRDPGGLRGWIEDLRRRIRSFIGKRLSYDNGILLKALVVGDMGELSKEMRGAFTAAGVNHVLSISGLHVAMLGLVVFAAIRYGCGFSSYMLLRFNLLKLATFGSFVAVVFYTALAGAMVPTVRSAIMIGVYQLAVLLDREEEVFTSLALAALLIGLIWPGVIADISFQLSFLAVLFIAWGTRNLQRRWKAEREREKLPQERPWWHDKIRLIAVNLLVPLMATLGTGPLIAHYFGHLSLAGFIANPLIVPLVGFVVVPVGLLIGCVSILLPEVAPPLIWMVEHLVNLTLWLVSGLARLPLANISVPAPNVYEIAGLYAIMAALLLCRRRAQLIAVAVVSLSLIAGDSWYWWRERFLRRELRVTHLNVGQGDAAVIELPGGKVLLVDAGGAAFGDFDTGESIVAPFLRSRKILQVDYLLVSHARIDHYGGMAAIVREFAPQEFWSAGAKGKTERFAGLEELLEQNKTRRIVWQRSDICIEIDRVRLCPLYPATGKEESPLVFRLEFGALRILFPSDIGKSDEAFLVQRPGELLSPIFLVPRHGHPASSNPEFIRAVAPRLAIISGTTKADAEKREEVADRYRRLGAEVLRSATDGAIIIESDGKELRYATHKSGKRGRIRLS